MSETSVRPARHRARRSRARWFVVAAVAAIAASAAALGATALSPRAEVLSATQTPSPTEPPPSVSPTSPAQATVGPCERPAGSAPVVNVADINVGVPVAGYAQERDTDPLPMAIAAAPDGGSWLAWLSTNNRVYLGKLDCHDRMVATPISFEGVDLQDVLADSNGGVLLLTRQGQCGTGPLCGGTSSPRRTMHMVRFDNSGNQVWERQLRRRVQPQLEHAHRLGSTHGSLRDGLRHGQLLSHRAAASVPDGGHRRL